MSKTSIVMVTRNRYRLLAQTLQSLYDHTPREQFNLTIVDDSSDDFRARSLQTACTQRGNCANIVLHGPPTSLAHLKNVGVESSRELFGPTDYLYISDNDVYFTPGWLQALTDLARATTLRGYCLWGGQVHPFHKPIAEMASYNEHEVLDGPSWLMEWPTWRDVGPLRGEALGPGQSEDGQFCSRLTGRSLRIAVIKPHVVIHTGLTNTLGEKAPGYDLRVKDKVPGVLYE